MVDTGNQLLLLLLVGFLGVLVTQVTGHHIDDGLASIGIGLILGGTVICLDIETRRLLVEAEARRTQGAKGAGQVLREGTCP